LLTGILFLLVLIALNAFFAASEIAFISLNDHKIRLQAEEGNSKAQLIKKLLDEPSGFLATIQIGITLAGFLASAFASETFADKIVRLMKLTGLPLPESVLKTVSMIAVTVILAYFTLVLGELVPKRLAMQKAEAISQIVIRPLRALSVLTYPFVKLLTISTNFFVRLLGVDPHAEDEHATEEEIRLMIDVGEEKGTIDEIEKVMINNIFEFDNKTVAEIMTHRTKIVALPVEADFNQVIEMINAEKYTRMPVYEKNIDNIIGILHSKDIFEYISKKSSETFNLKNILRQPYFVPSSKRTDELFTEMQRQKIHMAIIIDEYGGTAGLVTMEDLVEEIVGNIFDEYDEEESQIEKLDENTFLINGSLSLDLVRDYLDVELPTEDYETLSGFIVGQLGRIPRKDDHPSLEYNGLVFKVEKVEHRRIAKVKVCRT
jgi:putative hemolysin